MELYTENIKDKIVYSIKCKIKERKIAKECKFKFNKLTNKMETLDIDNVINLQCKLPSNSKNFYEENDYLAIKHIMFSCFRNKTQLPYFVISVIGEFDAKKRYYLLDYFLTTNSVNLRSPSAMYPFSILKHAYTKKYLKDIFNENPDWIIEVQKSNLLYQFD